MAEDEIMIEDDAIALEDTEDTTIEDAEVSNIIPFIMERYKRAEDYRYQDEERWLRAYRNYRGLYGPDVQFTEAEKSRVFIKVTKTKTLAAYGQIVDVLFAANRFPLSVEPTELPEGVVEDVHPLSVEDELVLDLLLVLLLVQEQVGQQQAEGEP